jgi:hypothetical protein
MPTRSPHDGPQGDQVPRVRHAPNVRANDWEDVSDLAKAYGLVLDPWQENVLQAAMGVRADGQWAAKTVGVNVPRQNGKGAIIEARELAGLLLFGEKVIIHSAHEMKTARVGFERILSYFENYDDLRKKVKSVMSAVAREHIKLRNGAELHFPARSKGGIRGFSIDCLILDEAQILGDTAWEAIKPTISARPNTQTWLLGTTPTPLDDSAVFTRNRQRGIDGKDTRLAWCEWSVPHGSDIADPNMWAQANPALGGRISIEAVEDELAEMSPEGFARERLSMWLPDGGQSILPDWPDLFLDEEPPPLAAIGLAASEFGEWGSIASADLWPDGRVNLSSVDRAPGTAWLVGEAKRIQTERGCPVAMDEKCPDATLLPALIEAGVNVSVMKLNDYVEACSELVNRTRTATVTHQRTTALDAAVAAVAWRSVGDGRRVFGRVKSKADIDMLEAATAAMWTALANAYDVLDSIG